MTDSYKPYLIGNVIALFVCIYFIMAFPTRFVPELHQDPIQKSTNQTPFYTKDIAGRPFYIAPHFDYELFGLVVSKHNARKSYNTTIDKDLNVTDLCVIWGDNVFKNIYKEVTFSSGDFTCFVHFKTRADYNAYRNNSPNGFKGHQLSNNHLLVDDPRIAKAFRNTKIGDQIHIKGYLASYGADPSRIYRGTSTSRYDTGNGACETVYITDYKILKSKTATFWYILVTLLSISLVLLWVGNHRLHMKELGIDEYLRPKEEDELIL